jgi:hypothetical protein
LTYFLRRKNEKDHFSGYWDDDFSAMWDNVKKKYWSGTPTKKSHPVRVVLQEDRKIKIEQKFFCEQASEKLLKLEVLYKWGVSS